MTKDMPNSGDGWFRPDTVFDGTDLRSDISVRITDGMVSDISTDPLGTQIDGLMTPGFFDLQVNGGGGVLFNEDPSLSGAKRIFDAHGQFGTAGILPTLITDAPEALDAATQALLSAPLPEGILGFHIEGPHISVARRGTHDPAHIRPFDARTLACIVQLRQAGIPVLITLAPEAIAPGDIARLHALGVVISLGHSDCGRDVANAAFKEGANLVTHLFNGMSHMLGREPGMVGAAINSEVYASIIADGIHVDPDMIGLAFRARPVPDRMILVSDAMPTVGGPDSFELYGNDISVVDGALRNQQGDLAGAHVTMLQAFRYTVETVGIDKQTALRAAITNPARVMGLEEKFDLQKSTPYILRNNWIMMPFDATQSAAD